MMDEETQAEIARLTKTLNARKNRPGFGDNCRAIQARIDELSVPADEPQP